MQEFGFSLLAFAAGCVFVWFVVFQLPDLTRKLANFLMWEGYPWLSEPLWRMRIALVYPSDVLLRALGVPLMLRPSTIARGDLATCFLVEAKFKDAVAIDQELSQQLGKEGADIALGGALGRVANGLKNMGDLSQADSLSRRAMEIAERNSSIATPFELDKKLMDQLVNSIVAEVFFCRADVLKLMGRTEEEISLKERALKLVIDTFGPDESICGIFRMTLGASLLRLKDYERAAPLIEKAVEIRRRDLSKSNYLLISGEDILARLYTRQGKLKEAESLLLSVIKRSKKNNPDYFEYLADLGYLRRMQGKPESLKLYEEALMLGEKIYGKENPLLLELLDDYSEALNEFGNASKGEELAKLADGIRLKHGILSAGASSTNE